MPSLAETIATQRRYAEYATSILGYCVAGLLVSFVLYQLVWWFRYKLGKLKDDEKRMEYMRAINLPAKPRYPIFGALVAVFCFMEGLVVVGEAHEEVPTSVTPASVVAAGTAVIKGTMESAAAPAEPPVFIGAYINGPGFVDLEANTHGNNEAPMSENKYSGNATSNVNAEIGAAAAPPDTTTSIEPASALPLNEATFVVQPPVHRVKHVNSNDSDSAPSVYFSDDDSSDMSEIINAMVQESTEKNSRSASVSDVSSISHSGSSNSDDSHSSVYLSDADNMV